MSKEKKKERKISVKISNERNLAYEVVLNELTGLAAARKADLLPKHIRMNNKIW